ncbi:hypothetical protein [Archangium violaceum]|uniref:Restriction endonuclease type IV Mrr domain-containing protein n=1 Tax=Archangium violaceum Cb vi76 TaxID=1406225 RepID=A0A084SS01_9BACT|nr:hypothetical protein [Archangium violaceum]KFA91236.1 hypothetical protein Q664_23065 [Archangium violaceum Cb vi76]
MGRGKAALRREYEALKKGGMEAQERGRRLEGLVYELLESESLHPRRNTRPPGEEIDLSFTDGYRHFLLEARWRSRVSVGDVFAFRGKLEGKLAGTLGVFLYLGAEFSKGAIQAMTWGKGINTLLFSEHDLDDALSPEHSFREVLELKLRYAVSYGQCHATYRSIRDLWRKS